MPPTTVSWFAAPAACPCAPSGHKQNSENAAESPIIHGLRLANTTTDSSRTMPIASTQAWPSSSDVKKKSSPCPNAASNENAALEICR